MSTGPRVLLQRTVDRRGERQGDVGPQLAKWHRMRRRMLHGQLLRGGRHVGDKRGDDGAPAVFRSQVLRAGGFVQAAEASLNVEFPTE